MNRRTRLLVVQSMTLTLATAACGDRPQPTSLSPEATLSILGSGGVPSKITVSPTSASIAVGQTSQLIAYAYNGKGRRTSDMPFAWSSSNSAVATVSPTGLVTAVAAGAATVAATIGPVSASAAITVTGTTPPPPPPGSWTYCTPAGNVCSFIGLRQVRLAAPTGAYVSQIAFGSVPCATYGFNNQNPAPGQPLFCDYGPLMTTTMPNPSPGMGGLPATIVVAQGNPGAGVPRTQPSYGSPVFSAFGAFRTQCSLSKFAFDDPIVYPGQVGASHVHMFMGNTGISATTTPQSLAGSGNSTCRGGILNRSAYWMPALFDSRTGEIQTPAEGTFYYKTGYSVDYRVVKPFPAGLRMIAGDKQATGIQRFLDWGCTDRYVNNTGSVPTTCGVGAYVRLTVIFPQCWDGKNLDAADHKSHMAYPIYRNPPQVSTCPSTHPVTLPEITEIFDFPVTSTSSPRYWRLASDMYSASLPGGYSVHADWMNGWDPATMQTIVTQCLNKGMDCGVGSLGNGRDLY